MNAPGLSLSQWQRRWHSALSLSGGGTLISLSQRWRWRHSTLSLSAAAALYSLSLRYGGGALLSLSQRGGGTLLSLSLSGGGTLLSLSQWRRWWRRSNLSLSGGGGGTLLSLSQWWAALYSLFLSGGRWRNSTVSLSARRRPSTLSLSLSGRSGSTLSDTQAS